MTERPGGVPDEREFEAAGKRLSGAWAVHTSDDLLDDGAHGLRFFREFLPLLADRAGQGPDFDCDVRERYDDLRGIDFAAFREDARRVGAVHQALLADNDLMSGEVRAALRTWQGEAAEAAAAEIGGYIGVGSAVLDELESFGGAIPPVIDGIERAVREYARFVLEFAADMECAGKTPDEARDEVRKSRGDLRVADLACVDDVFTGALSRHAGTAKNFIAGKGPLPGTFGAKEACNEIRRNLIEGAGRWLDTAFKPELQAKLRQFEQQSISTQECVRQAYEQLLSAVEVSEDPFHGVGVRSAGHAADSAAAGGGEPVGPQPAGTAPQSAESSPGAERVHAVDGPAADNGEPPETSAADSGALVDGPAAETGESLDGPAGGPVESLDGPAAGSVESPDGPASTTSQSAGSDWSSAAGGTAQSAFADLSERLFGGCTPEQDLPAQEHSVPFGGPPPPSGALGLASADQAGTGSPRGTTGLASISEPDAAQNRQQSAGSSAETMGAVSMGTESMGAGTVGTESVGAGTVGAGMLGMGAMGGDQQGGAHQDGARQDGDRQGGARQGGDQERPAGDRRAEAWFDVAGPGTTPVLGEDRE